MPSYLTYIKFLRAEHFVGANNGTEIKEITTVVRANCDRIKPILLKRSQTTPRNQATKQIIFEGRILLRAFTQLLSLLGLYEQYG
jgi:hypothetical protein